ncbi:hypothetical protein O6H91_20G024200 [Diphasiastrum complanatum]|uniref:Uncharacterized protein n=1 Tax=Diphasiastrum complanatum TaxID=34168 RepID=A0ACC2ANI9_DIPCM|nr:hypothetical protein O6H91_20G024200 [Diphasiastrum complanatum]
MQQHHFRSHIVAEVMPVSNVADVPFEFTVFDQHMRKLELDAYIGVLRAFGAQSEAITWAKERLMTDLRKELRISDEEHRSFLGIIETAHTMCRTREGGVGVKKYLACLRKLSAQSHANPKRENTKSLKKHKKLDASQGLLSMSVPLAKSAHTPAIERAANPNGGKASWPKRKQPKEILPWESQIKADTWIQGGKSELRHGRGPISRNNRGRGRGISKLSRGCHQVRHTSGGGYNKLPETISLPVTATGDENVTAVCTTILHREDLVHSEQSILEEFIKEVSATIHFVSIFGGITCI